MLREQTGKLSSKGEVRVHLTRGGRLWGVVRQKAFRQRDNRCRGGHVLAGAKAERRLLWLEDGGRDRGSQQHEAGVTEVDREIMEDRA